LLSAGYQHIGLWETLVMNPFVNIPIFIQLTEGLDEKKKREVAKTANIVAFIIVVAFIIAGKYIFQIFGLTIPAFKIFGGILTRITQ
jgi:multiple antibiotic resistance protein